MASPNELKINIAKEQTLGVLPARPSWKAIRSTGSVDIGSAISTVTSKELRTDRQFAGAVKTSEETTGSIPIEMSPDSHDILMEGCFFNTFSTALPRKITLNLARLTITNNVKSVSFGSTDSFAHNLNNIEKNDWLRLEGFSNSNNNGYYRVLSKTSNTVNFITVPAGAASENSTRSPHPTMKIPSRLKNGVEAKSYTIEQQVFKTATAEKFQKLSGAFINSMSIDVNTNSEITGSFGVIAKNLTLQRASISGTPTVPTKKIFSSNNVLGFSLVGVDTTKNFVSSSSFSIENGIEGLFGLGIKGYAELPSKRCTVEANFSVYLNDLDLVKKAIAAEKLSLTYILESDIGDEYIIDIPSIILSGDSAKPQIGDVEGYVTLECTGSAVMDPDLGYQIAIYKLANRFL